MNHGFSRDLEAIPESWQSLTDVVRELLIKDALQIRSAHSVRHVTVRRMTEEEFPLGRHGCFNVLPAFNVLLGTVDHSNIATPEGQQLILEYLTGVRPLVHQIKFRNDTNCPQT